MRPQLPARPMVQQERNRRLRRVEFGKHASRYLCYLCEPLTGVLTPGSVVGVWSLIDELGPAASPAFLYPPLSPLAGRALPTSWVDVYSACDEPGPAAPLDFLYPLPLLPAGSDFPGSTVAVGCALAVPLGASFLEIFLVSRVSAFPLAAGTRLICAHDLAGAKTNTSNTDKLTDRSFIRINAAMRPAAQSKKKHTAPA